jgi:septum formation protein
MRLILASASPRRAELLRAAGLEFEQTVVDVDERVLPGEQAPDYVARLAGEKAERAWSKMANHADVVLGADTAVVLDSRIMGKPVDDRDAAAMLFELSGRVHRVMTGVYLRGRELQLGGVEITSVWVRDLGADEVAWYVGTGEWRDKAGGYAIQGLASRFIPRIEGSYSNVVGLPVALVHDLLEKGWRPRT